MKSIMVGTGCLGPATISSPLVPGASASLIARLESATIIDEYRKEYGYDVSNYFTDTPVINIYECQSSGYRFYHPFSLVGKEDLYQHLQQFDWNYKSDKWEYDRAAELIPASSNVLDVGCGKGAFLTIAGKHGLRAHGLELNSSAASIAKSNGLSVFDEMIGEHANANPAAYNAVCSFQVLEHIPDVHQFITDCIRALKPGGTLIFGVPNNDGFLKYAKATLNTPPHHMGLWTRKSLTALTDVFDLRLKSIETEPLAEIDWYTSVMENRHLTNLWLRTAYYKIGISRLTRQLVARRSHKIPGHTILATYEKI